MLTHKSYNKYSNYEIVKGGVYKVDKWNAVADTIEEALEYSKDLQRRKFDNVTIGHNGTFFTIGGEKKIHDLKEQAKIDAYDKQQRTIYSGFKY
jgi:5-keto 4-deoxyuronate isomerase